MKKYTLFSFIFILSLILLSSVSVKSASAANCAPGEFFSSVTGQSCGNSTSVVGCQTGYEFSPVTGQSCSGTNTPSVLPNNSGDLSQFNNLFNSFTVSRTNSNIKALQQFLKDQGYYFGKIDGKYGKISARAVSDFQIDNNEVTNPVTTLPGFSITPTNPPMPACLPRPSCLDSSPRCMIAEPVSGWCPVTTSQSPVISGVSGPQTLNVNQQGTWSVTAYDTNKGIGNLSYSVVWGDENIYPYPYSATNSLKNLPAQQSATFTHSYLQAGNYTPKFTVTNFDGQVAQTSLSVNVITNIIPPTQNLTITTASPLPNAKVGNSYTVVLNVLPDSMPTNQLSWMVISSLPYGLYLSASDYGEIITGTPTVAGSYTFTLSVTMPSTVGVSSTSYATKQFTLTVDGTPISAYPTFMPGCSSTSGWSSTTGKSCAYLPGCSSASGYSSVDGQACDGTTPTTNDSPKITMVTAPQYATVGQVANFSFSATDPNNDNLSWGASFQDASGGIGSSSTCPSLQTNSTFNTSHTWNTVGSYLVQIFVNDCKGGSDQTSFTVNVTGGTSTTPPSVFVSKDSLIGTLNVTAGNINQKIGSYTLAAPSQEGVQISNITVALSTTASQFQNLKVMVNGNQAGHVQATLAGGQPYTFSVGQPYTFAPLDIPANGAMTLDLYADVMNSATPGLNSLFTSVNSCSGFGMTSSLPANCTNTILYGQDVMVTGNTINTTQCSLSAQASNVNLTGNGTTWGFDVTANATPPQTNSSGWTANFQGYTPVVTRYGTTYHYGDFFTSHGPLQLTVRDQINSNCTTTINVAPPAVSSSANTTLRPGCSSTLGYSSVDGTSCAYSAGCSSNQGYSSVDGSSCTI